MTPLHDRVEALKTEALRLRAAVANDALRERLDIALAELERVAGDAPGGAAEHALVVPAGRIRTVSEIVGGASRRESA